MTMPPHSPARSAGALVFTSMTDPAHGTAFNAAYRPFFGEAWPARSTVVSALLAPGALIEVEAVVLQQ
ncbi:RidA family protein [Sphingopyxis flava]|uniref:Uncharacterized protein n=1 Tax=Sphingopyxis flava TaxID=1507287 RepID=A0A1T5ARF9_9SPHN|nr:RidA family protein [Sphingopyxis flava]SKB37558.1 hypothetical protein SAMN06295937_1004119 [Sphingopyxis flava]